MKTARIPAIFLGLNWGFAGAFFSSFFSVFSPSSTQCPESDLSGPFPGFAVGGSIFEGAGPVVASGCFGFSYLGCTGRPPGSLFGAGILGERVGTGLFFRFSTLPAKSFPQSDIILLHINFFRCRENFF
jgi:hypothetical protein